MPALRPHARLAILAAALPFVFLLQTRASGQDPSLEATYTKLEPKEQFKYKWKGKEATTTAGVFHWEVPKKGDTEFGTNGLDRNYTGYCAEVLVPMTANNTYKFRFNSIYAPENYGLGDDPDAPKIAQKRAILIRELFGRYFQDPVKKAVNADDAVAFQYALWELIQEPQPAEGERKLDLFGGEFQANYPQAEAPASVLKAQQYLGSLTGNDSVYYENPDLRGRELVRLQGIPNADGLIAQSQFALRYAGGGGVGGTLSRALTGSGIGGLPVLGGGGGGAGGGAGIGSGGGGGAFLGGSPGSGSTVTTIPPSSSLTTPPTTPPSTTTSVPPVGQPPETPTPPGTPPETPTPPGTPPKPPLPPGTPTLFSTTPVPAPAGLILGAIALGTLGSWRLGMRLLRAK
jgi:hypothetical protein